MNSREICPWCSMEGLTEVHESVYWELPDGTRAIEIKETPSKHCSHCEAFFQSEETVKEIEDQLFLVDTKKIAKVTSYKDLIKMERLLKRNYFDFS